MKKKIFIILLSILLVCLYILFIKEVIIGNVARIKNNNINLERVVAPTEKNLENLEALPVNDNKEKIVGEKTVVDKIVEEEISDEVAVGENKKIILLDVPFTSQAPFGEWSDLRQEDGCEEASSIMAMFWVDGKKEISKEEALKEIIAISEFELEKYGSYMDTSASDTIKRILETYFDYNKAELQYDIEADDIIAELEKGNIVMAPFNGRKLGNINYTAPGPERHMLLIIGYDYGKKEFITNDPGTRNGKGFRYDRDVLMAAIRDYVTGENLPILEERRAMIVISK